ncbi:hypothetical protein BDV96DRAFT_649081 [Lophiotrema nucula]|uniref:Uncharacterized protein n=1 Tax=Lophiotrema nucula TaxID=690887 RepID=A0A6A5YZG7_9PLEO|nr:hypothetical protein BDV96DRAFT_649081 [Lophiotrema nucula]
MESKSIFYDKVPTSDDIDNGEPSFSDTHEEESHYRSRDRYIRLFSIINTILLLVLVFLVSINLFYSPKSRSPTSPSTPRSRSTNCGNTTATAKAAGCLFDPLGYLWTPPECYDHVTVSEFRAFLANPALQFGAFPFFRTNDTADRISGEEELAERVGIKTYSTQQEHLAHCAYMLRRLERAREGKVRWDGKGGYAHVEHCSNALAERLVGGENPLDKTGLHSVILLSIVEEC